MANHSKLGRFLTIVVLLTVLMPAGGGRAVQVEELPTPLPRRCSRMTPIGQEPPACCISGYVYHDDAPQAGADVRIESAHGVVDTVTASGEISSEPYYGADLSSAPLLVSPGDVITITASHGGMSSSRIWTVQDDGQQVDLGLLAGYQAPDAAFLESGDALDTATLESSDWLTSVQEDIQASEYHVTWQDQTYLADVPSAYQAPNRAHNLRTYFTPEGIRVVPRTPPGSPAGAGRGWEWGLTLTGYGREGSVRPVPAAEMSVDGNHVEYGRGDLTEWYANDERGLEQGFTLAAAPESTVSSLRSPVALELDLTGNLTPNLTADGSGVEFTTPSASSGQAGGVRVLHYGELHAVDAAGRELVAWLKLQGAQLAILVDDAGAVYPVTVDPLATSPSWAAEGNQAGAEFGISVGTAGDVNADGYADVVVGAYCYDNGQADEGRAYVYHGSVSGLSTAPDWTAESDHTDAWFGFSVGTAGDVNGDGYADVIVGAYKYDNGETDEGRAFVYHGSASGLSATPNWTAESDQADAYFGNCVATAGDVNGDGYGDVIVAAFRYDNGEMDEGRVYVYYGSPSGVSTSAAWTVESDQYYAYFGYSVGTAGDVNGDGYADVAVGAFLYNGGSSDEGMAQVYHGSASGLSATPDWMAEGNQTGAYFGYSVGTAGDVNGDGYADVIVSAPLYTNDQSEEGRVFVYHGSASGVSATAAWTGESDQDAGKLGISVGTAGDVNGDGYADVVVGTVWYDSDKVDGGRVYIYHGSTSGLSTTAAWTADGDQTTSYFGISVGTAGDVNGDGYSDIIVGASRYDNGQADEGRAWVYYGGPDNLSTTAAWTADGGQDDAHLGTSLGTAGDVNGDGYADVIIGAGDYDGGQVDEGLVLVYHGAADGLAISPDWSVESDQAYAHLSEVATAGDVNGDGYADIIVAAGYYNGGHSREGRVYLYCGSKDGLSETPAWTAEGNQAYAYFGIGVGTAGDVNGDGYADVIIGARHYDNGETDEGAAFVYHGSADGLGSSPDWMIEGNQAGAVLGHYLSTAGDVNGDGYADVIIGVVKYDNGQTDEGRAYVYHGSADGLSISPNWMAESNQAYAKFGIVGAAGDVNGDGYADVIVGAPYYNNGQADEGQSYIYHGSASGLSTSPDWTAEGDQAYAHFGVVAPAGDVNGDGYADVIIGAKYYDNGQTDEGRAYVYNGSASGVGTTPAWIAESDQDDARLGRRVFTAGDVNGDGYADIIVDANRHDNGQADEGRVFLYYGNGSDGLHLLPRQMRTDGVTPIAPGGMSDSATSVQLSLIGRSPAGRAPVKMEYQVAPLGTSFDAPAGVISSTSAAWTDVLTTGVAITETVTGLSPGIPYHWRARLLYAPGNRLGQPASRWVHMPWNGWTETDFRTPGGSLLNAGFVGTPRGGPAPLEVTFTDLSTGDVTDWLWDFGDGITSTLQSPVHTYTLTGTYTVSLTVSGPAGSDAEIKTAYITAGYPAPSADFTGAPLAGPAPLTAQFADQSTGAITQWDWTFGDGGVGGARYPEYEYANPGTYTVSLTVAGPGGSNTETKVAYITVTAPVYLPPTVSIDFISPNPAVQGQDAIHFGGSGHDNDEGGAYIAASVWTSDLDGWLSDEPEFTVQASALSTGTHTISFKVQDDEGEWSPAVTRTLTVQPPQAGVRTLVLVNRQKLESLYGTAEADQVMDKLDDLALHTNVDGLVVQVESDPTVAAAYTLWDADPTSTEKANGVVAAIKALIDSHWAVHQGLEYLVVVGDDRVIPFHRALDRTPYPESRYGAVSPATTVGAALQDDMTLTDDYYADEMPAVCGAAGQDAYEVYIPDLGIGRLVETPSEIVVQIEAFLANDTVAVDDAIVTGYGLVEDAAQEVCSELSGDGLTVDCSLIGDTWNGAQFEAAVLDARHDVVSFNGHADHFHIGAPVGSVSSEDVVGAAADHTQALFYTPGCHSGLNVPPANPYQSLDTAQAMARNRSIYVANTGYGWGFVFSVGLSEQLMVDFSERLVYGQSTTVGQALTAAKQDYYLGDHHFDAHDEKVLLQSTLYGLPMLRYTTPAALALQRDTAPVEDAVVAEKEMRTLDGGLTVNSLSYQFPALLAEGSPEGQYYTLGGQVHSGDGQPLQPKYVADLSFPGTNVHGVVFAGGTYGDIGSFNPVVDRAITETTALEPAFIAPGWYPAVPHQLNHLEGDGKLVTLLGQYNAQGLTERIFERQSFDVYYHISSDDWTPPTILGIGSVLAGSEAVVSVEAADDSGIHTVVVAYTSGNGVWASTSLVGSGNGWSGNFPADAETTFFVQVVDGSGNVAVDDNYGFYFTPGDSASVLYFPILSVGP